MNMIKKGRFAVIKMDMIKKPKTCGHFYNYSYSQDVIVFITYLQRVTVLFTQSITCERQFLMRPLFLESIRVSGIKPKLPLASRNSTAAVAKLVCFIREPVGNFVN